MPSGRSSSALTGRHPQRKFFGSDVNLQKAMASRSTSKPFPGFSSLYYFRESFRGHPFRAEVDIMDAFGVTRAEVTLPGPVQARWAMGRKKPGDIIGATL